MASYEQLSKPCSTSSPSSLIQEECAVNNPANPTKAELEQYQNMLLAGERYVVTRRRIANTKLLTSEGNLGDLELQEFGSATIKAKSWSDIKDKDIPYVCYNKRSAAQESPRTGPSETTHSHPGLRDGFKYCHLNDLKVHGGTPFGSVPGQTGEGRLYFYKIGFNKIKPVASLDAVTDDANGAYPDFKPLSGGDGVVLVGFKTKEAVIAISGTDITSYKPVVIRAHKLTTRIKAYESKSIEELRGEPSASDTLIDLNIGDLVVDVKKLNKKSNFQLCRTGGNGIRG